MTSTGELGDGSIGTTHAPDPAATAEGDDIVVIPGGTPDEPRGRQLLLIIGAAVVSIGVIVAAVALLTRHDGKAASVAVQPPAPSVPVVRRPSQPHPTPHRPTPTPTAAVTVPATTPAQSPVVSSPAHVPTAPAPAPTITIAPPQQYGASALAWDAPHAMTIPSGKSAALTVMAFNRTDGVVNLPHPLSCTPRLDHTEVCTEMVQTIPAGGSATATYLIDARGVAPGKYSLRIEGVLTVDVTVS